MKNILKIAAVGFATTLIRIIGQMIIPPGEQTVLAPSVFAVSGTMPAAFTVYGVFAYSIVGGLFLIIKDRIYGSRIIQGLKYGICCSVIWSIYLLEPLPHVAVLDKITYPAADSAALLVMGVLLGAFFGKDKSLSQCIDKKTNRAGLQFILLPCVAIAFVLGRMIQYRLIGIYSSYGQEPLHTMIWCICAAVILACCISWVYWRLKPHSAVKSAAIAGGLIFGGNLTMFNFFMPLVFQADIPDLILRTLIDVIAVTAGCLAAGLLLRNRFKMKDRASL